MKKAGKRRGKQLVALFLVLATLFCAVGCAKQDKQEKVEITMYLWDKNMTRNLTPWLEKQFPDIKFTFVVGYNTMAYYTDLTSRGAEMPDIITCRRFSINDAAHLSDQLMDMSQTEIVGTFYSSYIENNRETDGGIRWLPMCAEVDGFIANLDLFEKYNIPVPTNYAEFVDAINRFEEAGIEGFATDWNSDYTCMEALQGNSIPDLMSMEGTMWRREYESETEDGAVGLDDKVWPVVFERFSRFLQDVKVPAEDATRRWADVSASFREGKAAIIRGTANDCAVTKQQLGMNCVMLPYFGETEEDNWLLTYPMCQLAVAKHVEQDADKKDAIARVLSAIFSEEGQRCLASGASVLSYNKTVNIDMGDSLTYVKDCIDRNHLYMRLASTEMFSVSKTVVQKMIKGEYDASAAYRAFHELLTTPKETPDDEILITQNTAYPYTFGDHGSQAASSLLNTMRAGTGDEIAIGYSNVVSSPIFTGDYTMQQLKWLMTFKTVAYRCEYTGEEIRRTMEWLVNVKEDGSNPIRHYNNIPVTSGMEYTVTDNGDGTYTLGELTVNGKPLEMGRVYTVLLLGEDVYVMDPLYCNCPMPEDLKNKRVEQNVGDYNSYDCMLDGVTACEQLIAPTDYVTVLH